VKVVRKEPPIYKTVCQAFKVKIEAYFTYGGKIYITGNLPYPPDDILAHEKVHIQQQGKDSALWWGKYLRDTKFRVEQEAEGYAAQYRFLTKDCRDREKNFRVLHNLAQTLSGSLYDHCVSYQDALKAIKTKI